MEKVNEDASIEFKWLKKRGVGGKNKDVQFYESFIYDGVEYKLYDCLYMYKEGLREPYIGKLAKIWDGLNKTTSKTARVKIHWFFRPQEISNWLGETKTLENEIFFASGEGHGLVNINPLEAIAGPCNVVCVSKDNRNPQPSDEQLKTADFIFYRTFDVRSCTILDKMDDQVGGLEIKYVFNKEKDEKINSLPENTSNTKEETRNIITSNEAQQLLIQTIPNKLKDDEKPKAIPNLSERNKKPSEFDKSHDRPLKKIKPDDKTPLEEKRVEPKIARDSEKMTDLLSMKSKGDNSVKNSETVKTKKVDKDVMKVSLSPTENVENKEKNKTLTGSDKLHEQPSKKIKPDDKTPLEEKHVEPEIGRDSEKMTDLPSMKSKGDNSVKNSETFKTKKGDKDVMKVGLSPAENVESKEKNKTRTGSDKLHEQPLKKKKLDVKSPPNEKLVDSKSKHEDKLHAEVNNNNNLKASGSAEPTQKNVKVPAKATDDLEGKMLKKTKDDSSKKMLDNKINKSVQKLGNDTTGSNGKDLVANSALSKGKSKSGVALDSPTYKKVKDEQCGESNKKLSANKSFKGSALSTDGDKQNPYREFVVSPKPNAERAGWFKQLPWEERLKKAYDEGTAILLYNLDPDFTSREVEDIIWHALNEHCEAKIVQRTAVSSPNYGQALILLKTKDAAQRVLTRMDEGCLMLPNKRPLVAIPCPPLSTKRNSVFFGHLTVDKARFQNQREDEAVSTSHFSQPNTIEYEMAMEWCLLQLRSKKCWEKIHKQQEIELKKLVTDIQAKKA